MEGDRDVGHADHTPADHHDDHRNNGFSGTAEDSGGTVGKGQEEIKQRIDPGLAGSTLDDFRCAVKGGDQMGNEKIPTSSASVMEQSTPKRAPFLTRSYFFAPMF